MATVVDADDKTLTPASRLVGMKVSGGDGEPLGTIAELMLHADDGRINYAALAAGGWAGVGEKLYAVPWKAFVIDPVDGSLKLHLSRAELLSRTGFDKDRWPSASDSALCP